MEQHDRQEGVLVLGGGDQRILVTSNHISLEQRKSVNYLNQLAAQQACYQLQRGNGMSGAIVACSSDAPPTSQVSLVAGSPLVQRNELMNAQCHVGQSQKCIGDPTAQQLIGVTASDPFKVNARCPSTYNGSISSQQNTTVQNLACLNGFYNNNQFFGELGNGEPCVQSDSVGDLVGVRQQGNYSVQEGNVCVQNYSVHNLHDGVQPVCEGKSSDELSWSDSQVVNDALARFQADVEQQSQLGGIGDESDFLSVTGSEVEPSLTFSERNELEILRGMFRNLSVGDLAQNQTVGGVSGVANVPVSHQNVSANVQNVGVSGGGVQSVQRGVHSSVYAPGSLQPMQQFQFPGQLHVQQQQQQPFGVQQQQQNVQLGVSGFGGVSASGGVYGGSHTVGGAGVAFGRAVGESAGIAASAVNRPTLVPREVKLAKPTTFSGKKSEVDNFIFEMRQYVDSVGLGDGSTACRFVVSHLKEQALTWWRSYSKDSLSVFDTLCLDELFDGLKEQFSDIDEEMKLRDKILGLKQTNDVGGYVSAFKNLQLRLGSNRLPDEVALHVFLVGLRSFTRGQVMLHRPDTLEEAVLLAERAEQSLYWQKGGQDRRQFYKGGYKREDRSTVSQYSNSRYKGQSPMVLGNVQQSANSKSAGKATVTCYHCGKTGHYKRDCWKLNGKPSGGKSKGGKHANVLETQSSKN